MNNLIGQRFGRLTVLRDSGKRQRTYVIWSCICDCGIHKDVPSHYLKTGHTRSCGCLRKESWKQLKGKTKHGDTKTRLFSIWIDMRRRCNTPTNKAYKYYGNKGIQVCNEWQDNFITFKFWAILNGYQDNLTIDRINHKGNYEPSNCQWLTLSENVAKSNRERACV